MSGSNFQAANGSHAALGWDVGGVNVVGLVAYAEGYGAAIDGADRALNPYADGSADQAIDLGRQAWFDGWEAGAEETTMCRV